MNDIRRDHIAQAGGPEAGGGHDLGEALLQARRHSRRVRRLKILLPATAALMVAGFVAYSYVGVPRGVSIDLSGTTLEDGRIIMANPKLDGYTRDNRAYSMRAHRAMQEIGNSSMIELEKIGARVPFDDANWADIEAERGLLDREANTLRIEDGMTVRMDNGVTARFRSAKVDMAAGGLESSEPVTIEMDGTNISADSMRVTDRGSVMIFENRVRMEIDGQRLQTAARDREPVDAQSQ